MPLTAQFLSDTTTNTKISRGRKFTRKSVAERYWKYVENSNKSDCWNWLGHKDKLGYGRLNVFFGDNQKPILAHRIALALSGIDVPQHKCVLHECDNPSCCNPNHLRLGSKHDNNSDMRIKKRSARGEINGKAVLSNDDAIAIKDALNAGIIGRQLAKQYNVSESTISSIKHGTRWIYLEELRKVA